MVQSRNGVDGSDAPRRRGVTWWSPAARRLHLTLAIALPGCLAAGWFELTRALHGHEVAWVYAGEWPLFAVCGTYVWWRLVHAEAAEAGQAENRSTASSDAAAEPAARPEGEAAGSSDAEQASAVDDPGLVAWQQYLERLHAVDPPGGPPVRI